jgi:hypothetical protein
MKGANPMSDERDEELERLKKLHDMDQNLSKIADFFPRLWRQIYLRLLEEGFNEVDAMQILKAYVIGSIGGGKV